MTLCLQPYMDTIQAIYEFTEPHICPQYVSCTVCTGLLWYNLHDFCPDEFISISFWNLWSSKKLLCGVKYITIVPCNTEVQNNSIIYKTITLNASKQKGLIASLLLASIISTQWKLLIYFEEIFLCLEQSFLASQFYYFVKGLFGSLISSGQGTFQIGDFVLRKKGRKKTQTVKVAKSCHQVTWAQKNVTKKRELCQIFNFKIFKCE